MSRPVAKAPRWAVRASARLLLAVALGPLGACSLLVHPTEFTPCDGTRPVRCEGGKLVRCVDGFEETTSCDTSARRGDQLGIASGRVLLRLDEANLKKHLDLIQSLGVRYVQLDLDWSVVEAVRGSPSFGVIDRVCDGLVARGLVPVLTVTYTPEWARPPGTTSHHGPAVLAGRDALDDYAAFLATAVKRYRGRARHFELWNEPNSGEFWLPAPEVARYAALLKKAYAAAKRASPEAVILTGGTAPVGDVTHPHNAVRWVEALYAQGCKGSFDAVAHHPSSFPTNPLQGDPGTNAFLYTEQVAEVMRRNGEASKRIWATAVGAPTGSDPTSITEAQQAQWVTDYTTRWFGPWAAFTGPLLWQRHADTGTSPTDRDEHFGLVRADFSPKPALARFREVAAQPLAPR
ncbi:MAG: hypothetical protein IT371_20455 [Deltaproteobacteria bacterium]|nr:hypothetical protein [Deltaproteobacteria bacterium]